MFSALTPSAFNFAWVALGNPLLICAWHSAQFLDPTNSAPGISRGMITTRLTVTHEINTATETMASTTRPLLRCFDVGRGAFALFIDSVFRMWVELEVSKKAANAEGRDRSEERRVGK